MRPVKCTSTLPWHWTPGASDGTLFCFMNLKVQYPIQKYINIVSTLTWLPLVPRHSTSYFGWEDVDVEYCEMPPLCPGLNEAEIKTSLNTRMKPFIQLPAYLTLFWIWLWWFSLELRHWSHVAGFERALTLKTRSVSQCLAPLTCRFLQMYCFENSWREKPSLKETEWGLLEILIIQDSVPRLQVGCLPF